MKTFFVFLCFALSFQLTALDEAMADATCREIADSLNMGDPRPFNNTTNPELFLGRLMHYPMPEEVQKDMHQAAGALQMMSQQFVTQVQQGALVDFLGVAPFGGADHTGRFRIVSPQSNGYVYFFALLQEKDDKIVIADVFTHNLSMWMSEYMLQTMILGAGPQIDADVYNSFWGQEIDDEEKQAISRFYVNVLKDPQAAVNQFETMPAFVKEKNSIVTTLLTIANRSEAATFEKALSIANAYIPDSPLLHMFMVAKHSSEGDMDAARQSIERIYKVLGKDAYYYYQHANLYAVASEHDKALKAYEAARQQEPGFYLPYVDEAWIYVIKGDYKQAVAILTACEKQTEITFDRETFEKDPDFAGFVASDAFNTWKPAPPVAAE